MRTAFPKSLGFKLQLNRSDLFPFFPGADYASCLADAGFDYVEFSFALTLSDNRSTLDLLRRHAEICRDHRLGIAIHPGPDGVENDTAAWFLAGSPGVRPVIEAASLVARTVGSPVAVVLHPAQFSCASGTPDLPSLRSDLVRRCNAFFAELHRAAAPLSPPIQPVAEHQLPTKPGQPLFRIGDTALELLDVACDTAIPLCLDTGHFLLGVERSRQPQTPPPAFLASVAHVHLHDVVDGLDHRPLSENSNRVRNLMDALRAAGFTGRVTLEYAPEVLSAVQVPDLLRRSLAVLASWSR